MELTMKILILVIWVVVPIYSIECTQINAEQQVTDLEYLRQIYTHFRRIFWGQGMTTRQFAVVTVGRLTKMPNISANDFPLDHPYNYNAAFYYYTQPIHTEPELLKTLSNMIIQYLYNTNHLPGSVYLYTYNIPCPNCTDDIVQYIKKIFPNDLLNEVHHKLRYIAALQQIRYMTYRIGWTLEMVPDKAIATVDAFHDVNVDTSNSRLMMYRQIKLKCYEMRHLWSNLVSNYFEKINIFVNVMAKKA